MRTTGLAVVVVAMAQSGQSSAQTVFPDHRVHPAPVHAIYAGREAFLEDVSAAARAKRMHEGVGALMDPDVSAALMVDEVELLVASRSDPARSEFTRLGVYPPHELLAMLGRLTQGEHAEPVVEQRYGMWALEHAAHDRFIGPSDWLNGRHCNAAYGKIEVDAFSGLVAATGYAAESWSIAVPPSPEQDDPWDDRIPDYQLVALEDLGSRNASTYAIRLPDGGSIPVRRGSPGFTELVPYLNSHVCIDWAAGGWKVASVAIRLD